MHVSLEAVLLIHREPTWRREVAESLAAEEIRSHWACSRAGVMRILGSAPIDAVLLDLDVFEPFSIQVEVLELLTMASPAPAVAAWSSGELSAADAFEFGRLGLRRLLRTRPSAQDAVAVLEHLVDTPPMLAPRLRACVGHKTHPQVLREARELMLDQAIARCGGNKSQASRLLRITRQAIQQHLKQHDLPETG